MLETTCCRCNLYYFICLSTGDVVQVDMDDNLGSILKEVMKADAKTSGKFRCSLISRSSQIDSRTYENGCGLTTPYTNRLRVDQIEY